MSYMRQKLTLLLLIQSNLLFLKGAYRL